MEIYQTVRHSMAAASSTSRGVFAGGSDNIAGRVNTIEYVTIASTGNATDFGDLSGIFDGMAGCSNAHGGL